MPPFKLEVQVKLSLISPSSMSIAVPAKLIVSPQSKVAPGVGAVMVTVGGLFSTMVIVIQSLPTNPCESMAIARISCAPRLNVVESREKLAPV